MPRGKAKKAESKTTNGNGSNHGFDATSQCTKRANRDVNE
jgi:hypothetical protein